MKIYLTKDGKSQGPFTEEQLARMRDSGEISQYQYIWKTGQPNWQPLALPPPPPLPVEATLRLIQSVKIQAICHDHHTLLSGELYEITEGGCILQVENHDSSPGFSKHARVVLNLLEPASGKSMNVSAQLVQAYRRDRRWHYQIRWDDLPEILAAA